MVARCAERTVEQAVHEKTLPLENRFGTAAVRTGAAGRTNSGIDERREENLADVRTPADKADKGDGQLPPALWLPCSHPRRELNECTPAAWCAGYRALVALYSAGSRYTLKERRLLMTDQKKKLLNQQARQP